MPFLRFSPPLAATNAMEPPPRLILLCEDNEDDLFLFRRALGAARITNVIHHAADGEAAVDYLSGSAAFAEREKIPPAGARLCGFEDAVSQRI